jgi:L-asparaginase
MKNVLLILTGGTFGMAEGLPIKTLSPSELDGDSILKFVPEAKTLANIDWVSIFNLDSSDISPRHWENIGKTIKENYSKYDGFVIIHGTDTMVYSASAVSFMLQNTEKPIVFTGSQLPLSHIRTDARINLINAVHFATLKIPEVTIAFGSKLFRANRAKKISINNYKAFESYNYPHLARVGVSLKVKNDMLRKKGKPKWDLGFDVRVALLKIFPGMSASLLKESLLSDNTKGVIFEGFGSGNLPEFDKSWMNLIKNLNDLKKPVIITSQCPKGSVKLDAYKNGKKALSNGAISCTDITTEACVVKLMFSLQKAKDYKKTLEFMKKDYCGELSNN